MVEVGVLVSGLRMELTVWVEDVGTPTAEVIKAEMKGVGEVEGKVVSVGVGIENGEVDGKVVSVGIEVESVIDGGVGIEVESVIGGRGGSKNWTSPRKSQVIFGLVS